MKITIPDNYPNEIPNIEILDKQSFLIPKILIANLTQRLNEWENKIKSEINSSNKNMIANKTGMLEDLISQLMDIMEKQKLINSFPEQDKDSTKLLFNNRAKNQQNYIILYPKTFSFCWNPNGQILTFQYHKIDFSQIKQSDKIISNFNDLDDWVNYCKSTDNRNNKFSKTENKLFEDENNYIVYDKIRDLVDWKNMIDSEDAAVLSSINRMESLPNLFMSNMVNDIQEEHFSSNIYNNKKDLTKFLLEDMNLMNHNYPIHALSTNILTSNLSCLKSTYNNIFSSETNDPNDLYLINESTPRNNSQILGKNILINFINRIFADRG